MAHRTPGQQYVDVTVGGVTRRVSMKSTVLADGSVVRTYWYEGQPVQPDFEPEIDEGDFVGHGHGCGCNTCRPACPPMNCDPCRPPVAQPHAIVAGVVHGQARIGGRLDYDPAVWQNVLSARAYWYRGSIRMHSAKQPYLITEADKGFFIHVMETGFGVGPIGTAIVPSNRIGPIGDASGEVPVQVHTQPGIAGQPVVGASLVYTRGVWVGTPTPDVQGYWQRGDGTNWADIAAASSAVPYVIQQTDIGYRFRVREVARNLPTLVSAVSNNTEVVQAAVQVQPTQSVPAVIGGGMRVGDQVTYTPGSWAGSPTPQVTARWYAGNTDLGAASVSSPFIIPQIAEGQHLRVVETAINAAGQRQGNSNLLGPVTAGLSPPLNHQPPTISGSPVTGQSLTYAPGSWSGNPTPVVTAIWQIEQGGQWVAAGTAQAGVPRVLTINEQGSRMRVLETATGSVVSSLPSAAIGPVMPASGPVPVNTVAPAIAGGVSVGAAMTYTAGTWTGDPAPTITAVWQRRVGTGSWVNLGPAVAGTPRTVVSADENAVIRVLESAGTVQAPSNTLGPVTASEAVVLSYTPGEDQITFLRSGVAPNGVTMRPFLPWNHGASTNGFNPINNEPQSYVYPELLGLDDAPLGINPFSVADGELVISARKASPANQPRIKWPGSANATRGYWTSGAFASVTEGMYGRIKVRSRLTPTTGPWPAIWLIPAWGEGVEYEIDIMEQRGSTPTKTSSNLHKINWTTGQMSTDPIPNVWVDLPNGGTIDEFHDYEVHWTQDFIRYYVDDVMIHEVTNHGFHTPARLAICLAMGNGVSGWQDWPVAASTADPSEMGIESIEWTQAASDMVNVPVLVSRPVVTGGSGGVVGPGSSVTATPAQVQGATLLERHWIIGRRIIPGLTGLSAELPADLDDYVPSGTPAGSWYPVNLLETYTNPQGKRLLTRSADVLYRVTGQVMPSGPTWQLDEQRVLGQSIGGAEWYKVGVDFVGNAVTEQAVTSEHGVGLSGMARSAGAIRIECEAVVSGITGHTQLQFATASGSWSHGASALFPLGSGGTADPIFDNGWTVVSAVSTSLGGGQYRLRMVLDVDATSTGFVWILRGYQGTENYLGSPSRGFELVSSSIKRVAMGG